MAVAGPPDTLADDMKPLTITADDELDEFGLPIRKIKKKKKRLAPPSSRSPAAQSAALAATAVVESPRPARTSQDILASTDTQLNAKKETESAIEKSVAPNAAFKEAESRLSLGEQLDDAPSQLTADISSKTSPESAISTSTSMGPATTALNQSTAKVHSPQLPVDDTLPKMTDPMSEPKDSKTPKLDAKCESDAESKSTSDTKITPESNDPAGHSRNLSTLSKHSYSSQTVGITSPSAGISQYSHQALLSTPKNEQKEAEDDSAWQEMPAYASYDMYDDDDRLVARERDVTAEETYGYAGLGGAGKGYTRVDMDDDAESATSMDENTKYLFREVKGTAATAEDDDEQRDAVSQMQATKDLLTEGQRVAYVGMVRLEIFCMVTEAEAHLRTCNGWRAKRAVNMAVEHNRMWAQKMMIRLYAHMEINPAEQIMIEQLAEHGVVPADLVPALMTNSRVKNPMAEESSTSSAPSTPRNKNPRFSDVSAASDAEAPAGIPPPYEKHAGEEMPHVQTPSQMPTTQNIDIDLRWTVLCDLFLLLIADSVYDARSRTLLERVGKHMEVSWLDICRFEKRVTDALEMQQAAEKENWNEDEHLEQRRKLAQKRRYLMMGLATVGGGLVIGLSAGLLAPVIGAGLAAGFTTIGVSGTSGFLAGTGGAAIITSSAAASGSVIGGRAAGRRTGAVKTFEYRPLHNNKRVNLVVTVSGWMTGKVDDVRLPFSTVDSVMGDIYSVLWEPEMLRSMGDTINILATEALTQGLQQVLGSTILISLMAALQLPVVLTKLAYLIDNPWAVSLDRATSAGLILADSLIDRSLGTRPVTLVGYSLGSRVIFSCLQELARKGAYGLVQNVYLYGSPIVVKKDEYLNVRSVVSGYFLNGYNRNDWILGYLFRLTSGGISRIAGLAEITDIPGIDNFDCTEYVSGHMQYRTAMPRLLRESGWMVESDEFNEIEDPDPENHQEHQRELINEIEEARKELEREGKQEQAAKSGFSFWKRKKQLERAEWEVYEDKTKKSAGSGGSEAGMSGTPPDPNRNSGVLFDVEAIRAELAQDRNNSSQSVSGDVKIADIRPPPASIRRESLGSGGLDVPVPGLHAAQTLSPSASATGFPSPIPSPSLSAPYEKNPVYVSPSLKKDPYGFEPYHTDEIEMTFDTSFTESVPAPPPPPEKDAGYEARRSPGLAVPSTATDSSRVASGFASPVSTEIPNGTESGFTGSAMAVNTAAATTAPVPVIALADPWADYDDDDDADFGKEQEISLTFA
ncbi:hypothetical protein Cpir12675_004206 [Ceratocystis pirilliformis]|uniref:Membrane protein C6F6.13c n=1 Tax=Ceratocystis pirilliformis TaxID=259994 RepID=A0ABR3YXZ4_9PEZI